VLYNLNVYDVTRFISVHPGGEFLLTCLVGFDISTFFEGKTDFMGQSHQHSGNARQAMQDMWIGKLDSNSTTQGARTRINSETTTTELEHRPAPKMRRKAEAVYELIAKEHLTPEVARFTLRLANTTTTPKAPPVAGVARRKFETQTLFSKQESPTFHQPLTITSLPHDGGGWSKITVPGMAPEAVSTRPPAPVIAGGKISSPVSEQTALTVHAQPISSCQPKCVKATSPRTTGERAELAKTWLNRAAETGGGNGAGRSSFTPQSPVSPTTNQLASVVARAYGGNSMLRLHPGTAARTYSTVRAFLDDPDDPNILDFIIKRWDSGVVSSALHNVPSHDQIMCSLGMQSRIKNTDLTGKVAFLACGVGIIPFIDVLTDWAHGYLGDTDDSNPCRSITVMASFKNETETVALEYLQSLVPISAGNGLQLCLHPTIQHDASGVALQNANALRVQQGIHRVTPWTGARGYFDKMHLDRVLPSDLSHMFLCGSVAFNMTVQPEFEKVRSGAIIHLLKT
jgi:ferredoxin-NADP reductase